MNSIDEEEYKNAPLFDFSMSSILLNWNKLVEEAKIDINEGYTLTSHDNRKLFLTILSEKGQDTDLTDRCLSHNQGIGMKNTYLDVSYQVRQAIFEDWWNFLRFEE